MSGEATTLPRGIRNRNPGNIRKSQTHWQGEVFPGDDASFCTFSTMPLGVRAAGVIFLNYQREHNLLSIAQMVNRWAPTNENNTAAYVTAVAREYGSNPDIPLHFTAANLPRFLRAIFHHENGGDFVSADDLASGAALALA